MTLKVRILLFSTFNSKNTERPKIFLWPFSLFFGHTKLPLHTAFHGNYIDRTKANFFLFFLKVFLNGPRNPKQKEISKCHNSFSGLSQFSSLISTWQNLTKGSFTPHQKKAFSPKNLQIYCRASKIVITYQYILVYFKICQNGTFEPLGTAFAFCLTFLQTIPN